MSAWTCSDASVLSPDGDTRPIVIRFMFDPAEPLVVTLRFLIPGGSPINWECSRDLLAAALQDHDRHGEADVVFQRPADDMLVINLDSPEGTATVVTRDKAARELIEKSIALVPLGSEIVDVDGFLARVMEAAS